MSKRVNIAILGSGTGSNAHAICCFAAEGTGEYDVGLIITTSHDAGICDVARMHGVELVVLESRKTFEADLHEVLRSANVSVLVLAGFMRLLPSSIITALNGRVLNIHPSLLPAFGGVGMYGLNVHRAVTASGVASTGATVHVVSEEYDQGAIILQRSVPIPTGCSPEALQEIVKTVEHELYPLAIDVYIRNT